MKTVYGPVPSWRFGKSLGIDPVCKLKVCSFDCVYCQLGETTEKTVERRVFVSVEDVLRDLEEALGKTEAEIVTFSGTAEPTLAKNLGEMVSGVKKLTDLPMAVLTNSSLISDKQVRRELSRADLVSAKLDAPGQEFFEEINKPHPSIRFSDLVEGLKLFGEKWPDKLCLQMMFLPQNKDYAREMADLAREIRPREVQLNTPLRPCGVRPLSMREMREVEKHFQGLETVSVYRQQGRKAKPISPEETRLRRPE